MDANSRKKPSQLEINNLIAEAVVNAEARRHQAGELLSDEELAAVKGGYTSLGTAAGFRTPFIFGKVVRLLDELTSPPTFDQNITLT